MQLSRLTQAEQAIGNHVKVVTTNGNLDEQIELEFVGDVFETLEEGVPTVYLRRKSNILPPTYYYAPALLTWLNVNIVQFDIVIIHGTWTYFNWACARICRKYDTPYLIFVHGSLDPWALNHHRWKKIPYWHLIEKSNFEDASGIIVLSEDENNQVRELGIDKPVYMARNGLLHPVPYVVNPDDLLEKRLPEIGGYPFVLFMSRLHIKKGLDVLLSAWERIHSQFPEWRLVIAGPDENGYLENLRHSHNGTVYFPGLLLGDIKAAFLQKASLFVLPSLSEGVPGAVVEAMAYGLPVIITPACHMPEVEFARAGLIVEPEAMAIADGLLVLLANNDLRNRMGFEAKELSKGVFDEIKVAKGLIAFCQSLLDRSRVIA